MNEKEPTQTRCKICGKSFKPYKVKSYGVEGDSTICEGCRKKYS